MPFPYGTPQDSDGREGFFFLYCALTMGLFSSLHVFKVGCFSTMEGK